MAAAGRRRVVPAAALAGLVLLAWLVWAPAALAATFVVNTTIDVADPDLGDGRCDVDPGTAGDPCSLRAAIQQANAAPAIPSAAHRIELPTGTFTLTLAGRDEQDGATGDLNVRNTAVRIVGQGATRTIVQAGPLPSNGLANGIDRILRVHSGANATVENLTLRHGQAGQAAAPRPGGGVLNEGVLTLVGVEVRDNQAVSDPGQAGGGGIANLAGATLTVRQSAIIGNSAVSNGGGVANVGSATLDATTIAENRVQNAVGGVFTFNAPSTVLRNVTLVANQAQAPTGGGLGAFPGSPPVLLANSILNNPNGGDCSNTVAVASEGFNLAADNTCTSQLTGPLDRSNTQPRLGPLALNGGQTRNFVPQPDSPALDAGANSDCGGTTTPDQRGLTRPQPGKGVFGFDVRCDIGAVEVPNLLVAAGSGDGVPVAAPSAACRTGAGGCTLRQAVLDGNAYGGAAIGLPAGTLTLSRAGRNEDAGLTGDIDVTAPLTVQGNVLSPTTVQAGTSASGGIDRVFHIHAGGQLVLLDLTVRFGRALFAPQQDDGSGGGVLALGPLTVQRSTIRDNFAQRNGGGISAELGGGHLGVADSTVEGNSASAAGGGIHSRVQTTIERSLVADNVASGGLGGGLLLSPAGNTGPVRITLTTLGRNQGLGGAGISIGATAQAVELTRISVVDNLVSDARGAALEVSTSGPLTMRGVLVAENPGPNCQLSAGSLAGDDNLSDDATCNVGANTRLNTDPLLGQLRNNGGFTRTHALLPGSPAIDTGPTDSAVCGLTETDQRSSGGVFFFSGRADGDEVAGARCDVGAFEVQRFSVTTTEDLADSFRLDGACRIASPSGAGNVCSLRGAIQEANAQSHALVALPAGTYTLTRTGAGEDAGATGDLDVTAGVTLLGASATSTFVQAGTTATNGIDRVLEVRPGGIARIQGVTLRNGRVTGNGGGVLNGGTLTLTDVGVETSTALGSPSSGGGLATEGGASITTLRRVLIAGNRAARDANLLFPRGGGIGAEGGALTLENVTVSGNVAFAGGGMSTRARTEMVNVTLANNDATESGTGDDLSVSTGTTTVSNTIFASGASNCRVSTEGQLISRGFNITAAPATSPFCPGLSANTDRFSTTVPLGALANNGGQTRTHALTSPATNPAVDRGNPATPLDGRNGRCAAVDQRNRPRPRDGDGDGKLAVCDVGAFEVQPAFSVGAFDVRIDAAEIRPGETVPVHFTWELPEPLVWRDLASLDLRLVDDRGQVAFWLRWTEPDDRYVLLDRDGKEVAGGTPGSATILRTERMSLALRDVRTQGSGPTGRTVTLTLPIVFADAAADQAFTIQVAARGDDGTEDPFADAATVRVGSPPGQSSPQPPDDKGDRADRPRKPTEEQRQQRQRTDTSSLDDTRTEGNVVAVNPEASPPAVTIAGRDGDIVLRLRGEATTVTVRVGDYVTAEGEKVHEQLYEIDSLDVEPPRR